MASAIQSMVDWIVEESVGDIVACCGVTCETGDGVGWGMFSGGTLWVLMMIFPLVGGTVLGKTETSCVELAGIEVVTG
jgi:hypothetical protein